MKDDKEILALTGLRFVAAFYVFVFHIHIRWPVTDAKFLGNILGQGAIGMSLFFILSGFVLAYRYADGKTPLRAYLINRFSRIYPIYAAAALVTLPWIGISMGDGSAAEMGKAITQGFLLVIANIFLVQAWFPQFFDYWNNGGSWSISVEAFCYVLLPFLLPTLTRLPPKRLLLVAIACYALATLPGLVGFIFPDAPRGVYYSMPIYRLPEFVIGVCCYLAFRNGWGEKFKPIHQVAFLVTTTTYLGFFGPSIPNYVGHNWIAVPFIAFMIFTLSNGKGILASSLSGSFLVWLGKISYSFYSFQALVIMFLISYHDQILVRLPALANNKLFLLFALFILVLISAIGYYLIEEPARRRIKNAYATRSTAVLQTAPL
ncbi:acyltransferase [Acidovorax sp. Be4]|uniref:Acyltransferase n=1 Tax=Acidovorax bellezanensis TaxID=2976702 RepID=A0ABT2PHH1_9BURK|nr:acyltransferase [Acidovorax sp. Be4]MCT9809906.1 acyltransferase [Acidovorax sp. Be4]